MFIEDPEALKNWLTAYLEPLCEADPQALAKYVMALVKKDKTEEELKSICLDQLEVFLQKETSAFVDVFFSTLKNKSYLQPLPATSTISPPANGTSTNSVPLPVAPTVVPPPTQPPPPVSQPPVIHPSPVTASVMTAPAPAVSVPVAPMTSNSNNVNSDSAPDMGSSMASGPQNSQPKRPQHGREGRHSRSRTRSRSRSRSPPASSRHRSSRSDTDMRRGANSRGYFSEDRSRRIERGGPVNRGPNRMRYGGPPGTYRRPPPPGAERRRSPSRSRSSRSRSPSFSSRSSRSRSRSRERKRSRSPRSRSRSRDKDVVPGKGGNKRPLSPPKDGKDKDGNKKRCRDFDEQGYCMRGDYCPFDHGKDPVILDGVTSQAIFGLPSNGGGAPGLLPTPGGHASQSGSNWTEPYNPEAPGIDQQMSAPPPPPLPHPHARRHGHPGPGPGPGPVGPPPRGHMGHMGPGPFWRPNFNPQMRGPPPGHMGAPFIPQGPQGRPRELAVVPTIPEAGVSNQSNRTVIDSHIGGGGRGRGRGGGRGGYRGYHNNKRVMDNADRCTLEVRKIPPHLNTITSLNQHFSKFGPIVNLQVGFEGDPEAAIVQFSSHAIAQSAHRNTEAVLNNRFIKVFWHSKDQQQQHQAHAQGQDHQQKGEEANGGANDNGEDDKRVSVKDRLGVKVDDEDKVNITTAISSSGSISRTVFNPNLLKKSNMTADPKSGMMMKTKGEQKKEKLLKKVELQKKRQEILATYMKQQKLLVEKLTKAKSDKEKVSVRLTVDGLSKQIKLLEEDLKRDAQEILAETSGKQSLGGKNKVQMEKELLDAEMDLYNKLHKGEASLDLQKSVHELRMQAKAFGISDGKPSKLLRKLGALRGRGSRGPGAGGGGGNFEALRKFDRRTRKILIADIKKEDQVDLLSHIAQFAEVESIDHSMAGAIVTFKSRQDAEMAVPQMGLIKFKDHFALKCSWFDESKLKREQLKRNSIDQTEEEMKAGAKLVSDSLDGVDDDLLGIGGDEDLLEEEETDDENESRSWRR